MKRFLLLIFHFLAESKKPKAGAELGRAEIHASEPGIIPIARDRRAAIFTLEARSVAATFASREEAKRA